MGITLKKKLISIITLLLLFMLSSSFTSFYLFSHVNDELNFMAHKKLPLSHQVNDITQLILEQSNTFKSLIDTVTHTKSSKSLKELHEMQKLTLDKFSNVMNLLVLDGTAHKRIEDKKNKIKNHLDKIENKYIEFLNLMKSIEDMIHLKEITKLNKFVQVFDSYERGFQSHLINFNKEMEYLADLSVKQTLKDEKHALYSNIFLITIGALLGYILSFFFANKLVDTVKRLVSGMSEVEKGILDVKIPITTQDEIGYLTSSFNKMIDELKMKERIKETFGKYMDPRIVQELLEHPEITEPGGIKREMTVMFIDLKGFTSISESLPPAKIVELINEFLESMTKAIAKNNGVVDKFIGDAVMAYWGEPFNSGNSHAQLACIAAMDALRELERLNENINAKFSNGKDKIKIDLRIGIASGEMIVGTIGSKTSRSFTVLGDSVNLASRLESLNKAYGTRVMISSETKKLIYDTIPAFELDRVRVLGKQNAQTIYEIKENHNQKSVSLYAQALEAYYQADWEKAKKLFLDCLNIDKSNKAAKTMLERTNKFMRTSSIKDKWDGTWNFEHK